MSSVYLSNRAHPALLAFLREQNLTVRLTDGAGSDVDERLRTHADLYMCQMGLAGNACIFTAGRSLPGPTYPEDAVYNAVCTGRFFVHNTRITDVDLLGCALSRGLSVVFVRQGYTRCCCLPVNDTSFITSDQGIAGALTAAGADVLTIRPGHIRLPGFPYGFFGGCGGHLLIGGRPVLVFNGDLSEHPDHLEIEAFASERGVDTLSFRGLPLEDIGSILYAHK